MRLPSIILPVGILQVMQLLPQTCYFPLPKLSNNEMKRLAGLRLKILGIVLNLVPFAFTTKREVRELPNIPQLYLKNKRQMHVMS